MNKQNKLNLLTKISVLSVSLIITTGPAISPLLPDISNHYNNIPEAAIESLSTVQQFSVVISLIIANFISKKIGIKKTVILGLLLAGFAGVTPFFIDNYYVILISRIVFGVGVGFFNSLAITVIDLLYSGSEKTKLLGIRTSMEQLGYALASLMIGALLLLGWRFGFLIYVWAIPISFIFWKYVPEVQSKTDKNNSSNESHGKKQIGFVFLALFLMLVTLCDTGINVELPKLLVEQKIGTGTLSGIVIAMKTTMAMIVGIFFGKIYNLLHWWVVPSGIVALLIGSLAIPQGHLWLVCLGSVISGIGSPLIGAYSFKTISETAPSGKENAINTMVLIGFNAGSFVAPIALTTGGNLFGGTVKSDFYFMASIFAILLVIVISQKIISRNQTHIKLI
ncbi:MFS transporter [Limosilactobacillus fermentum]|uniref:MFS transporter n=1 Tax=Limosilactobacillus fermentum TaxID=1613 RepID=UPI0020908B63|nr:MFS transporter [Limosilactobacillus fermentum]UVF13006.1 MFS transporter [Limosilactobacillus fermentum]